MISVISVRILSIFILGPTPPIHHGYMTMLLQGSLELNGRVTGWAKGTRSTGARARSCAIPRRDFLRLFRELAAPVEPPQF